MKSSNALNSIGLLLALSAAAVAQNQTYPVHLRPKVHAGQAYNVTANGSRSARNAMGDKVMEEEAYDINFEGRAEILQVDSRGVPIRVAFTVKTFTKTSGADTTSLVPAGGVIIADSKQDPKISLKDGAMDDPTREAFGIVFTPHKPDDVTDDDIFGTRAPRAIGDSWPIDAALAAESFKDTGMSIPQGHLNGKVSLAAIEKVAGSDCASLRGDLSADSMDFPSLPPGFTLDKVAMQATFRGCFPLKDAPSFREGADLNMIIRLASKDGTLQTTLKEKKDVVWLAAGN